jgi:hypothetical protein
MDMQHRNALTSAASDMTSAQRSWSAAAALLAVAVFGIVSTLNGEEPGKSPARPGGKVATETRKEILRLEDQVRAAIEKRDADVLGQFLTDYYTDSQEGGERALSKRGALAQCEAGKLSFLPIKSPRFSQSVDIITIEGESKVTVKNEQSGKEEETKIQVRRVWTKKDGRLLLIAQVRSNPQEREKETEKK